MLRPERLVCLVTPGHLASTPRLVRTADALTEAGYRVTVVSGSVFAPALPLDAAVRRGASWIHTVVDSRSGLGVAWRKVRRSGARRRVLRNGSTDIETAATAHHAESLRLARAASRIPADLYVGHCLAGLVAAALAARSRGVPYGFDAEDFHDAETVEAESDPVERKIRRTLLESLLPGCAHLTAASPLIGREYARAYGVDPLTVLNVFPRRDGPAERSDGRAFSEDRPARFYWFSQTIGPGRGLEAVVAVMSQLRTPAELHLRGFVSSSYREELDSVARVQGLRRKIRFLPPAEPQEMVRLAAQADVGLSVEERHPLNHDICLANKVFAYLLAGIPQILSATSAHRRIASDLGEAALLLDLDDRGGAATAVEALLGDLGRFEASRHHASALALGQFCWEVESHKVVESVDRVLWETRGRQGEGRNPYGGRRTG